MRRADFDEECACGLPEEEKAARAPPSPAPHVAELGKLTDHRQPRWLRTSAWTLSTSNWSRQGCPSTGHSFK